MTDENGGAVAHGTATARSTSVMSVHTVPAEGEAAGRKQGHGDLGLVPVMVFGAAPPWRPLARPGGRRPVVAVPDTGVRSHPWLAGKPGDPVVRDAAEFGWTERPIQVRDPAQIHGPGYRGHATFVAGVIRQTAPEARILSVPVMNDAGIVQHQMSLDALTFLNGLVSSGDADRFVDVICLAYGYEEDTPGQDSHTGPLREAIWNLAGQGVLIVASAGNQGEKSRPMFPAAFAADPNPAATPVISVGATNPDLSYAHYSNHGSWVTHQAVGSGVISTIAEYDGSQTAVPPPDYFTETIGSTIDPDNFTAGFARWSGTSFSAAEIAGLLARALSSDPGLDELSAKATIKRAKAALATIEPYRRRSQK